MDFIQRLALLFLLSIPAFMPNTAHADYPKVLTRYLLNGWNYSNIDNRNVCTYFVNVKRNAYPNENITQTGCTEVKVTASGWSGGAQYYSNSITKYGSCNGVESVWGSGICTGAPPTCQAPAIYNSTTGQCVAPPCVDGQTVSEGPYESNNNPTVICLSGCEALKVNDGAPTIDCGFSSSGNGTCYYYYPAHYVTTGVSCSAANNTPAPAPTTPDTCEQCNCMEKGGAWGSVGGINTCVPQGSAGSNPVTITPPKTTTTTTPAPTPENPNPTPVTSETQPPVIVITPAPFGSGSSEPSITETTTNPDGTTTTKTQTKGQYCAEKPTAEVCNGDGTGSKNSFGGNCNDDGSAEVACDGDAIQCAIAKQQKETHCKLFQPDQVMTDKYTEAKNDNGSINPASSANISTVHLPTALDSSSPYSGQCIQDVTIAVAGSSVTLPFSAWCPYLEAIGYLFLACAYISAAFILGSAV